VEFGIAFANLGPFTAPEAAAGFALAAEEAGFESLWTVEHVVVPAGYESTYPYDPSGKMPGGEESPIPDPLIWLSYLAGLTSRIKLATGVLILPQRNPVVLAKELATLDQMSGGRLLLGIGVGWLEEEFDAIGVPFAERGARTDENVAALRALWAEDAATYEGEHVSFRDCIMLPKPAQGSVPVHVGGHTEIAARRAGRLGDGFFPAKGSHEELARLFDVARTTAVEHGRDPDAIEMTTGGNGAVGAGALDEVKALADIGTDRVILPSFLFWHDTADALARYGDEVIAKAGS
jgi:probable F420-dependent oxidoreductase